MTNMKYELHRDAASAAVSKGAEGVKYVQVQNKATVVQLDHLHPQQACTLPAASLLKMRQHSPWQLQPYKAVAANPQELTQFLLLIRGFYQ